MAAVGHTQLAGEADQAVGADDRRVETVDVDAGRNGFDAAGECR